MVDDELPWSGVLQWRRGASVFDAASGRADASGVRPSTTTRFQAGSVSKAVVAVTVLHAVESGVLDLHRPISDWVDFAPDRVGCLTLHQLLTHTAGLGHWSDLPDVDLASPPERADVLRLVLAAPSPHAVGDFSYSAFGYLLAAIVLEQATGVEYGRAAREAVFERAGMTRTTSGVFPLTEVSSGDAGCAHGYHGGQELRTSPTPTTIPGTGDLWTTTEDLLRLNVALHEGRLLQAEHLAAMTSSLVPLPSRSDVGDPRVVVDGYGYGAWTGTVLGRPATICPGDNVGYKALLLRVHQTDTDLALLTNDDGLPLQGPLDLVLG